MPPSSRRPAVIALSVVVACGLGWWGLSRWSRPDADESQGLAPAAEEVADAPEAVERSEPERRVEKAAAKRPEFPQEAQADRWSVREPPKGLYGRVTWSDGAPIERCLVTCRLEGLYGNMARTDASGNYTIDFSLGREASRDTRDRRERMNELQREVRGRRRAALRGRKRDAQVPEEAEVSEVELYAVLRSLREPRPLIVEAKGSGGVEGKRSILLYPGMPEPLRVDFVLPREPALRGQVLGERGGVHEAEVMLFDRQWSLLQSALTDSAGAFSFQPPEAGYYRVHARKVGAGTASVAGAYLRAGIVPTEFSLPLGGDGSLRGQVVYPNGDPAANLELVAVAAPLALRHPQNPTWPPRLELAQIEGDHGLALTRGYTDDEGRFTMRAVQEGSFMLFFEGLAEEFQPPGVYTTGPEHELVYHARVLRVILRGRSELLYETSVHVVDRAALDPPPPRKRRHVVGRPVEKSVEFVVDPDTIWGVFWECRGHYGREQRVTVEGDDHELRVVLQVDLTDSLEDVAKRELPQREGSGRLVVELRDEEGQATEGLLTLWRQEGASRTRVFSRRPVRADFVLDLAPGLYEYRIDPARERADWSLVLPSEGPLELRAGETSKVERELVPAGRLRVTLMAEGGAVPAPLFCRVRLAAPEGDEPDVDLLFLSEQEGFLARATLGLGETARCEPLIAAGEYELQVLNGVGELCGSRSVKVEAGILSSVDVTVGGPR